MLGRGQQKSPLAESQNLNRLTVTAHRTKRIPNCGGQRFWLRRYDRQNLRPEPPRKEAHDVFCHAAWKVYDTALRIEEKHALSGSKHTSCSSDHPDIVFPGQVSSPFRAALLAADRLAVLHAETTALRLHLLGSFSRFIGSVLRPLTAPERIGAASPSSRPKPTWDRPTVEPTTSTVSGKVSERCRWCGPAQSSPEQASRPLLAASAFYKVPQRYYRPLASRGFSGHSLLPVPCQRRRRLNSTF